jgi:hypothetical protein
MSSFLPLKTSAHGAILLLSTTLLAMSNKSCLVCCGLCNEQDKVSRVLRQMQLTLTYRGVAVWSPSVAVEIPKFKPSTVFKVSNHWNQSARTITVISIFMTNEFERRHKFVTAWRVNYPQIVSYVKWSLPFPAWQLRRFWRMRKQCLSAIRKRAAMIAISIWIATGDRTLSSPVSANRIDWSNYTTQCAVVVGDRVVCFCWRNVGKQACCARDSQMTATIGDRNWFRPVCIQRQEEKGRHRRQWSNLKCTPQSLKGMINVR